MDQDLFALGHEQPPRKIRCEISYEIKIRVPRCVTETAAGMVHEAEPLMLHEKYHFVIIPAIELSHRGGRRGEVSDDGRS
jgi:hypothetical protein